MSGKPSSSPSSPPAGSAGLAGFVRSLRTTWRRVLLRFVASFIVSAALWAGVAAPYASLLASLARPLIPLLERASGTRYLVDGSTIVAVRPIVIGQYHKNVVHLEPLWDPGKNYGLMLLVALVLATPGWSHRRRGQGLGVGVALLTLTQLALVVVCAEYTQLVPIKTPYGWFTLVPSSDVQRALIHWLYAFLKVVGPGFFALLMYWGLLTFMWDASGDPGPVGSVGRNAP
jgi:hypothetical protein